MRWAEGKLLTLFKEILLRDLFWPFSNIDVGILVVRPLLPSYFENVPFLLCGLSPNSFLTLMCNKFLPNEQIGLQIG